MCLETLFLTFSSVFPTCHISAAVVMMNWREAVFAVIAALSIIFNLLFCFFLLRRPSVLKKPHNVLLFSLSAIDLVTGSYVQMFDYQYGYLVWMNCWCWCWCWCWYCVYLIHGDYFNLVIMLTARNKIQIKRFLLRTLRQSTLKESNRN